MYAVVEGVAKLLIVVIVSFRSASFHRGMMTLSEIKSSCSPVERSE